MTADESVSQEGYEVLASTPKSCVAIEKSLTKELKEIDDRKLARLLRIAELWCQGQQLTAEQFNGNEGRARRGDLNVMLQAFKTHKVRLFGIVMRFAGRRTFFIVDLDPAKKQNKADPAILKRAQGRALDLTANLENKNAHRR